MTTFPAPVCLSCKRFDPAPRNEYGLFCEAFGDKPIPEDIIQSRFDHREPHAGDSGLQFVQDESKPAPLRFPEAVGATKS